MSDDLDRPATPEEEAAARRLADALAGAPVLEPDEALAAARLLQALGTERRDEVSERRLRNELVRAAGRERRVRRERALAAASILLAALTTVFFLSRHRPVRTATDLDAQEARARAAVAQLLARDAGASRLGDLTDNLRDARLETLARTRLESVLSGGTSGTAARPSPTPGGPIS